MTVDKSKSSIWSREQDIAFENALATYPEDSTKRWEKIAADVPGKTLQEVKNHYERLLDDVSRIESGCVPLPCYNSSSNRLSSHGDGERTGKKSEISGRLNGEPNDGGKSNRRKGVAWTEDEHRLFLVGLEKYGKGDWRSISRNFVLTRTPTQVASHAQKYFIRLNSMNKDRRRTSIHDITSVNNGYVSVPQVPITGQTNIGAGAGGSSDKSNKQSQTAPIAPIGAGIYGTTTIAQPVIGPLVSVVGQKQIQDLDIMGSSLEFYYSQF
ncbi:unnamed protein product [Withania somnifera]